MAVQSFIYRKITLTFWFFKPEIGLGHHYNYVNETSSRMFLKIEVTHKYTRVTIPSNILQNVS